MGALFPRFFAPRPDALIVCDEISRGAYGTVYRGTLGRRPVAIKKIHQLLLDCAKERREELEGILKGFRDECELMEAAKHANVVEFIGVFEQDGSALLVIELMHQTLEEFLEKNSQRDTTTGETGSHHPQDCAGVGVPPSPRPPNPPSRLDGKERADE